MRAVLPDAVTRVRRFRGGAALVVRGELDQILTLCDVNEAAIAGTVDVPLLRGALDAAIDPALRNLLEPATAARAAGARRRRAGLGRPRRPLDDLPARGVGAARLGCRRPHPRRAGHRHERQDDERAPPRADGERGRAHRRARHHRRGSGRRRAGRGRRLHRPRRGADGAPRPARRRSPSSRPRAAGSCGAAWPSSAATSGSSPTSRTTTSASTASTTSRRWRGSRRWSASPPTGSW